MTFRWFPTALWLALAVTLMGSRCEEAEAVPLEALREDVAPPFEYGLYSDAQGRLEGETSAVLLVHRGEHLERVYADARAGNARARALFNQLEIATEAAGEGLADRALSLGCSALPTCTVKWAELGELIPSPGPGGVRLRQSLAHGFEVQARRKHVENAVITAALNALVVVGAAMAVETAVAPGEVKAGVGETRGLAREATAEARGALAGLEGRLDYVAYWERRYDELAGVRPRPAWLSPAKPPLEWSGYTLFRGRFRRALDFQRDVARTLQQQAQLAESSRSWLKGMAQPRVDENVGLVHEPTAALTYVGP